METGIEPVCTALQAVASPLGHSTVRRGKALLLPGPTPRADDGIRTRDPHLGKVMRYQLRYIRICISGGLRPSAVRDRTLADVRRNLQIRW